MMNELSSFFSGAPQNPYVFAVVVFLAVVSAWQPLAKLVALLRQFYINTVHGGIRNFRQAIRLELDRQAHAITSAPQKGAIILIMHVARSLYLALNATTLIIISQFLTADIEQAPNLTPGHVLGAIALLVSLLAAAVLTVDLRYQMSLFRRVKKGLADQ
jgi:hypothetical protein